MHFLRALRPFAVLLLTAAACGDFTLNGDIPGSTTGGNAPADVSSNGTTGGGTTAGETGGTTGGSTTGGSSSTTGANVCPTYANFAQKFFTDTCSRCHNANMRTNYQDFKTVVSAIDGAKGIKAEIDGGMMPQGGPRVSGATLTMIDAWMAPNCRK